MPHNHSSVKEMDRVPDLAVPASCSGPRVFLRLDPISGSFDSTPDSGTFAS